MNKYSEFKMAHQAPFYSNVSVAALCFFRTYVRTDTMRE